MKILAFADRNAKEILRDPLTIVFGLGFPLVLLCLLYAIQSNVPVELFTIDKLAPGISVFGLSFITLFSATVIAKDRSSAFLQRLYTTPMTGVDFILGYTLPMVPLAILQSTICYAVALFLGLRWGVGVLYGVLFMIPVSILYISMGLLFGSILGEKQVGGVCGALLTNLSAWLSGIWFDLELVGGVFQKVANCLPFVHAVNMERSILAGDLSQAVSHLWWVLGYDIAVLILAVLLFLRQMKRQ